ncbi:MAG: D-alanyl-D-alanine carboxypeptidase, partial [Alphaproteobacteria bacterium]|nr:D-alanyl-D-alanine carboxypeptidase [Alphaproteobacteria bacterium]NDA19107.1 D-alanyl-D-alanine carboxypeptidase [Alphaproteobacteria bacterium]
MGQALMARLSLAKPPPITHPPLAAIDWLQGAALLLMRCYRVLLSYLRLPRAINPSLIIAITALMLANFGLTASPAKASKYASIVIEESSGKVLFSRNADNLRYPASLTKIMTLYLMFEDIEAERITLKSRIPISRKAAGRSPSKLYL